ncbi:hypothetical protein MRX96_041194 [Rhipicephalus microplus]
MRARTERTPHYRHDLGGCRWNLARAPKIAAYHITWNTVNKVTRLPLSGVSTVSYTHSCASGVREQAPCRGRKDGHRSPRQSPRRGGRHPRVHAYNSARVALSRKDFRAHWAPSGEEEETPAQLPNDSARPQARRTQTRRRSRGAGGSVSAPETHRHQRSGEVVRDISVSRSQPNLPPVRTHMFGWLWWGGKQQGEGRGHEKGVVHNGRLLRTPQPVPLGGRRWPVVSPLVLRARHLHARHPVRLPGGLPRATVSCHYNSVLSFLFSFYALLVHNTPFS